MSENMENEQPKELPTNEEAKPVKRQVMAFDVANFSKLVINDLTKTKAGRSLLKKYKQSEVRDIVEGYKNETNQRKLREISQLLFAKSPQYQRLIHHFTGMTTFSYVVTPIKDIKKVSKNKVAKQYSDIGELAKLMNLEHEMRKVLHMAFKEDTFFGYIHRDRKSFYIQQIDANMCRITHIEDGCFNYSIDMSVFFADESKLNYMAMEVKLKYREWKAMREEKATLSPWVELDAVNTICIKANESIMESFPPFAGSFDAIFDIEGFKRLRKDKEELGNYMLVTQEVPIRANSENDNDFAIDDKMFKYFHTMALDTVPENVGVITSPMKLEAVKFDRDRVDTDGVAKAERDFWSGSGTSQLLFNADKNTGQGLLMSIKTDEEIVFGILTQIQRWVNRYLRFEFSDLLFNVKILPVTRFNQKEMFDMYLQAGQYGVPAKSFVCAVIGLEPIEVMNMAYLENDILKFHEEFIPMMSSHTMGEEGVAGIGGSKDGAPKKEPSKLTDEGQRTRDKSGGTIS